MSSSDRSERRWDIGVPRSLDIVGMPLLEAQLLALDPQTLADVHVLYVNHAISDALMVARAFRRLGAQVTSVLVPYRGGQGETQQAVYEAFRFVGPTFAPRTQRPGGFARTMATAVSGAVRKVAVSAAASGHRWMIVEDGGYVFPRLHDDPALQRYLACCLGAVEHTTRGRLNYEFLELDGSPCNRRNLGRPAVTIASSQLKTTHEPGFVAQGLIDECGWLLRRDHQFLRHRSVTVVGYGRVGSALADGLGSQDADVTVVDPAVDIVDPAHTLTSLSEAIRRGTFLVFGATGVPSMTVDDLAVWLREGRQDILYLASASSKDLEFAHVTDFFRRAQTDPSLLRYVSGRDGVVTCRPDPHLGTRYSVNLTDGSAKTCVLLADGCPVIFFPPDTHGAPNRAMDPVMTQLFLAACGLAHAHEALDARVYTVDDLRSLAPPRIPAAWAALMDEEGLLTQWCALEQIDPASYLRHIGFWSRPEPAAAEIT
ncbi:MAG: hypothetical protein ACRDYA_20265 [Egibacteraceae bacterium]